MSLLIEHLRRFNAKERFFLIGHALGNQPFTLGDTFRENLSAKIGITVPKSAFVAMDYHLDWIYASLYLAKHGETKGPVENEMVNIGSKEDPIACIQGNQEDIDLLVAFDHEGQTQLILLEAKGVTGWLNSQMKSKAKRLHAIFDDDGKRWPGIVPQFLTVSPKNPQNLEHEKTWPDWMKPKNCASNWIELKVPTDLRQVVRCDKDGKTKADDGYWTLGKRNA